MDSVYQITSFTQTFSTNKFDQSKLRESQKHDPTIQKNNTTTSYFFQQFTISLEKRSFAEN